MESSECDKRNQLRQNVYAILKNVDAHDGSQAALIRLTKDPEWKSYLSQLYGHIRSCPICRSKPPVRHLYRSTESLDAR